MTINLNQPPYYDDFDATKDFKQIVAVPGRVEQAREFTQIQTMTHNQIEDLFDTIYSDGKVISGCILSVNSTKTSVSITTGKMYAYGRMWTFDTDVDIPITGVGMEVIGVVLQETIITEMDDPTLLDPAAGYTNYMQPGAHRLKQVLVWTLITDSGLGVFTLIDGALPNNTPQEDPKPLPQTIQILDLIAQRDYERLGNYVISGLTVKVIDHPTDMWNKKRVVVKAGTASLRGYDVILYLDWYGDLLLARDTAIINGETYTYTAYDSEFGTGGNRVLAQTPVAAINSVIATVIACDGSGSRPYVRRGGVLGGRDALSEVNVQEIVAINQGGTWNSTSETFSGGTTYQSPRDYILTGNTVDWSPSGTGATEPTTGSTYSCAYRYRKPMTLEVVQMTAVTNELRVNNDSGGNTVTYPFTCEVNDFMPSSVTISNTSGGLPAYTVGTDFNLVNGTIDWYQHDVQVLSITKGSANGIDNITGFVSSYGMGDILAVAYYANPASVSYDETNNEFLSPTTTYTRGTDFLYNTGIAQISWTPAGNEPSQSSTYFIAVRARKYLTSNHPSSLANYYINYSYWAVITPGDYLARNSFYVTYYGPGDTRNVRQVYGLDYQNSVNFWRSVNNQNNVGNMDKPYPGRDTTFIYEYYLPRYVIVSFNATDGISLIYGNSSTTPKEPVADKNDMSVNLALLSCQADSIYIANMPFGVQTVKVKELNSMLNRTDLLEKQIAQTWLDLHAKSLPVPNKLGIMTLSFTSNDKIDPGYPGTTYSIDPDWQQLALPHIDYFLSTSVDTEDSNIQRYKTISTLVPVGSNFVEQTFYTGTESIAPYAIAGQTALDDMTSAVLNINPASDTLVIPRIQDFRSRTDAESWTSSDVSLLANPTAWFASAWSKGGLIQRSNSPMQAGDDTQTQVWTRNYLRDIVRMCRQISITWSIPGGLVPSADAELDYFLYFGGVLVQPILDHATPSGSLPWSFRPNINRGASGTFMIPPNIPEGRIEVRVTSTPMVIDGNEWRQTLVATFVSTIQEMLTETATECRCNCYCNCWCNCNCWCRGGSGPLSETLESVGKQRFLKDVTVDFAKVHPTYGIYVSIIKTDNGEPVTETIQSAMIARQYKSSHLLRDAGPQLFVFDDPVFQDADTYAIKINGEDAFNQRSIQEIAAGRDIRLKIATLGKMDIPSGKVVGSQPFKNGVLFRSLTGITWEQDQKSDLKFKASYYEYPVNVEQICYLTPISVMDATAFLCTWNSTQLEKTSIVFEYRTQDGVWTEFSPYQLTFLDEVTSTLYARARLKSMSKDVTPFVENSASFYIQSTQPELLICTNEFDTGGIECTTLDVWIDSFLPSGAYQILNISFNGTNWTALDNPINGFPVGNLQDFSIVNANQNNITYRYHWVITLGSPSVFTKFLVKINAAVAGARAQLSDPRFSNLIAIAS